MTVVNQKTRVCVTLAIVVVAGLAKTRSATRPSGISEQTKEVTCAGKMVDNDGRPIAKADVVLYYNHSRWGLGNRIVEQTSSAADGSFIFKKPFIYSDASKYPYGRDCYTVLATHPDHALGWHKIVRGQEKSGYELVLTEPKSQTVTVTDHAGNPLSGARVWPYSIGNPTDSEPLFHDSLSLPTDVGIVGGITGADGKAVVTNLPRTSASYYATQKGYARGLSFTGKKPIRLSKGATVSGSVLNEDGKPVQGAIIRLRAQWMWQFFLTRTDSQGRFRFKDLPAEGWDMSPWGRPGGASGRYSVKIEHDSYTTWETQINLEAGQVIDNLLIDAYPGTLVKCRVLEVDTNRPVAGARIYGRNESAPIDGYSGPDGTFRIRVTPGKTSLMFYLPPEGVYIEGPFTLQRQDLPESRLEFNAEGEEMTVTLRAPRIAGRLNSVRGIVLGPDGQPQGEAVVHAAAGRFQAARRGYVPPVGVNNDGRFELKGVPAGRRLCLYAVTKDRTLAGTAELDVPVEPDKTPFVQTRLQATKWASIIVKDETGDPVGSVTLRITPMVKEQRLPRADRTACSDAQGLLEIDGILPGLKYHLQDVMPSRSGRISRGDARKPFQDTAVLISVESDSAQEPTAKVNGRGKPYSITLRDYVQTEREELRTPLVRQSLPDFEGIDIEFRIQQAQDKKLLVCFWDMEQRPSRNCLRQLSTRAQELKAKDIIIVAVQASKIDEDKLNEWVKQNNIPFPAGMVEGDEKETCFSWGVRSLPWLILTDKNHIVTAEGFGTSEVDERIKE